VDENIHAIVYLWVGIGGLLGILFAFVAERKHPTSDVGKAWWWSRLLPAGRATWLFAAIVLIYPLPYYLTFPLDRYRLIVEPILMIYALHLLTGFRAFRTPEPADSPAQVMQAV